MRTNCSWKRSSAGHQPLRIIQPSGLKCYAVAENAILQQRESNRAFVLMQFFGYLRRNPNDAQDTDYSGFDFWLTKLNQFTGDFIQAEMVKAFISSTEYRQRFASQ